ncbi:hypothetical protein ACFX12_035863 [Malus domestica]
MGLLGILLKSGREEIWACKIIAHPACERPTREAAGSGRAAYRYYQSECSLTLLPFIIFFGAFELLSQLPDIHSLRENTAREPAKKNVYKDVSAAYAVIVLSYWQMAFTGYWIYCRPTYAYFEEGLMSQKTTCTQPCLSDFVFPALAYLKARSRQTKNTKMYLSSLLLNFAMVAWFSVVAVLGCTGGVKFVVEDVKTYQFFHDL